MNDNIDIEAKQSEIEKRKRNVLYPLLHNVANVTGLDVKTLLVKTYSIMAIDYNFKMKEIQSDFSNTYGDLICASGINVISSCLEYQDLFIQSLYDFVITILEKVQKKEQCIRNLLQNEFTDNLNQKQDEKRNNQYTTSISSE